MRSRPGLVLGLSVSHLVTHCSCSLHIPHPCFSHQSSRLTTAMYMYLCQYLQPCRLVTRGSRVIDDLLSCASARTSISAVLLYITLYIIRILDDSQLRLDHERRETLSIEAR